jgi:hypothetical protein
MLERRDTFMKQRCHPFLVGAVILLLMIAGPAITQAATLLISQTGGDYPYGYNSNWASMTLAINSAVTVTVTSDFSNLAQMNSYDAIWLDQRGTTGTLSATEISNIQSFIATGKRVVLMGENSAWTPWNNQLMSIVGGTYVGQVSGNSPLTPVITNALTAGISTVQPYAWGNVTGGTPLFSGNFATLWGAGQNVLVILDVNLWDDSGTGWPAADNALFGQNVAAWIGGSGPVQSVPSMNQWGMIIFMLLAGLVSVYYLRRQRRADN